MLCTAVKMLVMTVVMSMSVIGALEIHIMMTMMMIMMMMAYCCKIIHCVSARGAHLANATF